MTVSSWPVATSRRKAESSLIMGLSICLPSCEAWVLLLWHLRTILSSCFCRRTSRSPSNTHCTSVKQKTGKTFFHFYQFLKAIFYVYGVITLTIFVNSFRYSIPIPLEITSAYDLMVHFVSSNAYCVCACYSSLWWTAACNCPCTKKKKRKHTQKNNCPNVFSQFLNVCEMFVCAEEQIGGW